MPRQPIDSVVPIAGAGPAGLTAALTLAKAGQPCRISECRSDVGARFHGDYQGLDNWSTHGDVLEEIAAFGIEPGFDHYPVYELTLFDPWRRVHHCRDTRPLFYLVKRGTQPGTLDNSLKQQALAQGIPIAFNHARPLQGTGIIAHGPRHGNVIAVGYIFDTDMADGVYAALSDHLAPQGYAYLLVRQGCGTLAVCLFNDFAGHHRYLARAVDFFRTHAGLRMRNPKHFGGVGDTRGPQTTHCGDLLYAGEAAGFQDALFGFGMRYAMMSGHLAALAVSSGQLHNYDHLWKTRIGGHIRAGQVNRFLYARGGVLAYAYLIYRICLSRNSRDWLRRFYAPSLLKSLWLPLAQRNLGAAKSVAEFLVR